MVREYVLKVFVASPSDVASERSLLEEVIQEENIRWSKAFGIRLDLIRWETHTYPSVGRGPQDTINKQIGDDYDIFIGIMWTRAGTETSNAPSGTIEEFRRAYSRYKKGEDISIMFYFKNKSPENLDSLDLEQLGKIRMFKEELGEEGTYYWSYADDDAFKQNIRTHLSLLVQEWKEKIGRATTEDIKSEIVIGENNLVIIEDEKGIVDLLEIAYESLELAEISMYQIVEIIQNLTERVNERTLEIQFIGEPKSLQEIRKLKISFNKIAYDMESFCVQMDLELDTFKCNIRKCMETIVDVTMLYYREYSRENTFIQGEAIYEVDNQVKGFKLVIAQAVYALTEVRQSVQGLPNLQSNINKSKNKVIGVIDKFLLELKGVEQTVEKIRAPWMKEEII